MAPPTLFVDIDGCILFHFGSNQEIIHSKPVVLEGVVENFSQWAKDGYKIIITTGRKESMREITERQLNEVGISYDYLIMGLGGGKRYLINDIKPKTPDEHTAIAINLERNKGMKDIKIN